MFCSATKHSINCFGVSFFTFSEKVELETSASNAKIFGFVFANDASAEPYASLVAISSFGLYFV